MATDLTPEQRQAINTAHGGPVEIVDPHTGNNSSSCLPASMHLRSIFDDGPLAEHERRDLLRDAGRRAGWDDPAMDVYDDLDPRKS